VGIIKGQFSSSFQTVSCPAYKRYPTIPRSTVTCSTRPAQWQPMVVTWLKFYATLYLSLSLKLTSTLKMCSPSVICFCCFYLYSLVTLIQLVCKQKLQYLCGFAIISSNPVLKSSLKLLCSAIAERPRCRVRHSFCQK